MTHIPDWLLDLLQCFYLNDWLSALFVAVVAMATNKNGTTVPLREFIEMQMRNLESLLREGFEKIDSLEGMQKEHGQRIGRLEGDMRNVNKVGAVILSILVALVIAILVALVKGWLKLP